MSCNTTYNQPCAFGSKCALMYLRLCGFSHVSTQKTLIFCCKVFVSFWVTFPAQFLSSFNAIFIKMMQFLKIFEVFFLWNIHQVVYLCKTGLSTNFLWYSKDLISNQKDIFYFLFPFSNYIGYEYFLRNEMKICFRYETIYNEWNLKSNGSFQSSSFSCIWW